MNTRNYPPACSHSERQARTPPGQSPTRHFCQHIHEQAAPTAGAARAWSTRQPGKNPATSAGTEKTALERAERPGSGLDPSGPEKRLQRATTGPAGPKKRPNQADQLQFGLAELQKAQQIPLYSRQVAVSEGRKQKPGNCRASAESPNSISRRIPILGSGKSPTAKKSQLPLELWPGF